MENKFLCPVDLFKQYPEIETWLKRPQEVGRLIQFGLVDGVKFPRSCVVNVESILKLYNYKTGMQ